MKRQAILLVHGMGKHTAPTTESRGTFGDEFIKTTSAILQAFPKHKTETLEDYFDIHELNYDAWFDAMRSKMADQAKSMHERLAAIGGLHGITFPGELASRLTAWESNFGNDSFFYTHWLDVIFYGSLLGAKVRLDLALEITALLGNYGSGNVHVVAHSLGTAVVHDTLHQLFRAESDPNDEIPDLDPTDNRLGSIWMFGNVSRLVNSVTRLCDPLGSIVKPGSDGCTGAFFNARHKLDPFTWLAQFNPQNNEAWVPGNIYASRYSNTVTELITEANPHSFTHYLSDPRVWVSMLDFLLEDKFQATSAQITEVSEVYTGKSLNGAFAALESKLKDLSKADSLSSWDEFLKTAKALKDAAKLIESSFKP